MLGGRNEKVDVTSSGAFFDPKAVNRSRNRNGGNGGPGAVGGGIGASLGGSGSDVSGSNSNLMINQLTREMGLAQIGSVSEMSNASSASNSQLNLNKSSSAAAASGLSNPASAVPGSINTPHHHHHQTTASAVLNARTTSASSSSGYRSDNSIGS